MRNSAGTWCPFPLFRENPIRGTFKGLAGACGGQKEFSLSAGTSLSIHFRIVYSAAANVGQQTVVFGLETVNSYRENIGPSIYNNDNNNSLGQRSVCLEQYPGQSCYEISPCADDRSDGDCHSVWL